jgi:lipid-A-disaccharide synthase
MPDPERLMIVAGEASGDRHGAKLVTALRRLQPDRQLEFFGAGGDEMRAEGVETIVDSREVAIMGALEVARALPRFLRAFADLRKAANARHPRLVILIDWPEFNLRLARRLNRDRHRVIYYISPQLWAWRSYRIAIVREHVEKMLVILPFEQSFYARHGVDVTYVGHPLLDSIEIRQSRDSFRSRLGIGPDQRLIALLPGSRESEIRYILPPLLETASRLSRTRGDLRFVLVLAPSIAREQLGYAIPDSVIVESGDSSSALAASDLAVAASGTATLEAAILGTPLIVVYRSSRLNWRIFWPLINVPFVGMPNLIAGRQIVPELLQDALNPERLEGEIIRLIDNSASLETQREELRKIRETLGESDASTRAAESVLKALDRNEGSG